LTYPAPIVDVPTVARAARDAIWAVRRNAGFAHEAGRVICKHASRKDPQRHFVNDRTARRRAPKTDDRQSSFNF
jgi:deoxyribodipyrimidine photo-lyase